MTRRERVARVLRRQPLDCVVLSCHYCARDYDLSIISTVLLVVAALTGGLDVVPRISTEPPLIEAASAFLGPPPGIAGRGPVALQGQAPRE